MSSVLDNIFKEDLEGLLGMIKECSLISRLNELNNAVDDFKKTGDINLLNDALGDSKIPEVPTKTTRKKKQILESSANTKNILANIKQEKVSLPSKCSSVATNSLNIKQESEDMPAPTKLAPRKRKVKEEPINKPKRSTRTRKYTENLNKDLEEISAKCSDVIPLNTSITTVVLNDDEDKQPEVQITRSTRTKKMNKAQKPVVEEPLIQQVPTIHIDKVNNDLENGDYAAESNVEKPLDATFSITRQDDSEQKKRKMDAVAIKPQRELKISKPISKTNTKSKIEAFERLNETVSKIPKPQTPLKNPNLLQSVSNSTFKAKAQNSAIKTNSALKISQAEYRERERQRLEKETEAVKKKEAMLQAACEERKKKIEKKQLKVKPQTELVEQEKPKQMDVRKLDNRVLIQKATQELQQIKTEQRKENPSDNVPSEITFSKKETQRPPIYMLTKTPLLPTDDCYDSDDAEHTRKIIVPEWATEKRLQIQQKLMQYIGESIKNTFFCRKTHSPDLQAIFEYVDPKKLKRTSSAIWKKPPRFTLLSMTQNSTFTEMD